MRFIGCSIGLMMLFLAGCACLPYREAQLQVMITPDIIYPGSIVTVTVTSPSRPVDVKGRIDLFGSPVVFLKPNKDRTIWTWRTQIPLEAVWQSGRYRAVVEGTLADGTKVFGKAWVEAP